MARREVRPVPSCSSAYRRRDRDARAEGRGGGVPRVARGGAARSARSRHCRRRAAHNDFLTRSLSPRRQPVSHQDRTRLVLPRFSKGARRRPAPRCPRLTPGRTRGATPSTSSATRARAGSRREATGAEEETPTGRVRRRRRWRLGRWWTLRDRPRRRPPRRAPSTGPDAATARSRARSSWRWSARLERSGKRTRG